MSPLDTLIDALEPVVTWFELKRASDRAHAEEVAFQKEVNRRFGREVMETLPTGAQARAVIVGIDREDGELYIRIRYENGFESVTSMKALAFTGAKYANVDDFAPRHEHYSFQPSKAFKGQDTK